MSGNSAEKQVAEVAERLVRAGWATGFDPTSSQIQWTEEGKHTLEAAWCMLQELGGRDQGAQAAWSFLGCAALQRFAEPADK